MVQATLANLGLVEQAFADLAHGASSTAGVNAERLRLREERDRLRTTTVNVRALRLSQATAAEQAAAARHAELAELREAVQALSARRAAQEAGRAAARDAVESTRRRLDAEAAAFSRERASVAARALPALRTRAAAAAAGLAAAAPAAAAAAREAAAAAEAADRQRSAVRRRGREAEVVGAGWYAVEEARGLGAQTLRGETAAAAENLARCRAETAEAAALCARLEAERAAAVAPVAQEAPWLSALCLRAALLASALRAGSAGVLAHGPAAVPGDGAAPETAEAAFGVIAQAVQRVDDVARAAAAMLAQRRERAEGGARLRRAEAEARAGANEEAVAAARLAALISDASVQVAEFKERFALADAGRSERGVAVAVAAGVQKVPAAAAAAGLVGAMSPRSAYNERRLLTRAKDFATRQRTERDAAREECARLRVEGGALGARVSRAAKERSSLIEETKKAMAEAGLR